MTDDLAAYLQSLEELLLQPETRANPTKVAALLTDDFREFGSSGRIYTKPEILSVLAKEEPRAITLCNLVCQQLSPEAALLTYQSSALDRAALRSSLWVLRDGRWQMLFHQGTKTIA